MWIPPFLIRQTNLDFDGFYSKSPRKMRSVTFKDYSSIMVRNHAKNVSFTLPIEVKIAKKIKPHWIRTT